MERKLASVRKIAEVKSIPEANNIEVIVVDGWELVTQKSNGFKSGDLVVYFEIDSFLPVKPMFEFLRKGCFKSTTNLGDGFRIKTIKLRGQVSQGLALPLKDFFIYGHRDCNWYAANTDPNIECIPDGDVNYLVEGQDLTEYFGVKKWEVPVPAQLSGKVKGNYPGFIRKTDSERFQNLLKEIEEHMDEHFEVTVKLDGSSMTAYSRWNKNLLDNDVGVCSRNYDITEDDTNSFWKVANKLKLPQLLKECFTDWDVAIQGELVGPGVQKNKEKLPELDFYVYNIYMINEQQYLPPSRRKKIFSWFGEYVKHVPVLHDGITLREILNDPKNRDEIRERLIELSKGPMMNGEGCREGIVFKHHGSDFNFKVINPDFLLKYDE